MQSVAQTPKMIDWWDEFDRDFITVKLLHQAFGHTCVYTISDLPPRIKMTDECIACNKGVASVACRYCRKKTYCDSAECQTVGWSIHQCENVQCVENPDDTVFTVHMGEEALTADEVKRLAGDEPFFQQHLVRHIDPRGAIVEREVGGFDPNAIGTEVVEPVEGLFDRRPRHEAHKIPGGALFEQDAKKLGGGSPVDTNHSFALRVETGDESYLVEGLTPVFRGIDTVSHTRSVSRDLTGSREFDRASPGQILRCRSNLVVRVTHLYKRFVRSAHSRLYRTIRPHNWRV